jgi:hypothetical protein
MRDLQRSIGKVGSSATPLSKAATRHHMTSPGPPPKVHTVRDILQFALTTSFVINDSVLRKRSVASGRSAWDARFAIVWGSGRGRPSRRAIGLANIDIPRGMQAVQAWRRLDRRIRWAVRGGVGHPDPRVAAIAVSRARAMLRAG